MVVRVKAKRRRGERTYHGSAKKWRGKGSRGGRGKAGLHKHKWSWVLKYEPNHFGKKGFKPPLAVRRKPATINLEELDLLLRQKGYEKEVDLEELGYQKLLGKGKLSRPVTIKVKSASKLAKKKVEKIGGVIKS